jgi:hypothetical protein
MSTKYACGSPVDLLHVRKTEENAEIHGNWRKPQSQRHLFSMG